jgi:hypothetical protein
MRILFISFFVFCYGASAQQHPSSDTISDPSKTLQQLKNKIEKKGGTAELYCLIAENYFELEKFDSVIYYSNLCIESLSKSKNDQLLSRAFFVKGRAQYFLDDKGKAETNWREGLRLAEKEKAAELIPMFTSYLGAIYLDLAYVKNNPAYYITADSFFKIGYTQLVKLQALQSEHGLRSLRLMATSMHFQKKYDSADSYYQKYPGLSWRSKLLCTHAQRNRKTQRSHQLY